MTAPAPKPDVKLSPEDQFFALCKDRTLTLTLRGGTQLTGQLKGVSRYSLLFTPADQDEAILVMKSALDTIERLPRA